MGDVGELGSDDRIFLESYMPSRENGTASDEELPFVTLTYASSLDSMIALAVGSRTTLSGPETKRMTHYLRLRHDAILIGVGTAEVDDPSLNCRYPGAALEHQPRPVIIDPDERWMWKGKKVFALACDGKAKGPWIVSRQGKGEDHQDLLSIGGDRLKVSSAEGEQMPWLDILRSLRQKGIESVMIEGGATVINSLLGMPELVNSVVITIAPTWLGRGGVEVQPAARTVDGGERVNSAWLKETSWRQFGDDVVLCGRLSSEKS